MDWSPFFETNRVKARRYGCAVIRSNHTNLCVPSDTGLSDGLRPVFLKLPFCRDELSPR